MKILRTLLVAACLIFPFCKLFAQKDYVITTKNDTIHCKIRTNGFNNRIQYRVVKSDKFINLTADSITQYFLAKDSSSFIFKELPRHIKVYVKWIERGRVNLYEFIDYINNGYSITKEKYWYASRDSQDLVQIKHSSFTISGGLHSQKEEKKAFLDLFSDDPKLQSEYKTTIETDYGYDMVKQCIKHYNL